MATQSGGVDWPPIIKPILASLQGSNCDKNDIIELVQAIAKSDAEFQKYDKIYENFYTPLAALSAHFISTYTSFLGVENVSAVRDACRVLVHHLLAKLAEQSGTVVEGALLPTVSIKQLLMPLASLCGVEDTSLPRSDIAVLTLLLKDAKIPINTVIADSKSSQLVSGQSSERRRTDGLAEVLTGPLRTTHSSTAPSGTGAVAGSASTGAVGSSTAVVSTETAEQGAETPADTPVAQPSLDTKKLISETCISFLAPLRAGSTLLGLCGSLPCLQRYLLRLRAAKDSATCHYQHHSGDTTLVGFLVKEVGICQTAFSLPCLEPLTAARITLLSDISAAWLLCATTQASVHPKDEEAENLSAALVEGALGLFNSVGEILKNSTRAGGYVYQNHLMIGTWVLLSGLHQSLTGPQPSTTQQTGKSPAKVASRPYNLARLQQGVHVTWVALGFRCLEGARALLADARLEAQASTPMDVEAPPGLEEEPMDETPASLDVLKAHTAAQRAARLAACAPLHQLLVILGVVCYRKATALKRAVVQKQHEQDVDHSDSTVYYQDMIMCSEDSETDDEDSEPLLGLWFEATLVAPDGNEVSAAASSGASDGQDGVRASGQPGLVPDKAEPYSYISLATEVFLLLDSEVLPGSTRLGGMAGGLQETQVALLAALVKDLDRETARTDTGTISPCFGARLGTLYGEFSSALVRYLHSLTSSQLTATLRHQLMDNLGTSPPTQGEHTLVPLQVGCRVVKLVASVILGKPVAEREASILALWSRTVATVVECATQAQPSQDHEYEDINVEHSQVLVYLFHSLNLMQKKSVLLMTANAIINVCESLNMSQRKMASQVAPHQLMLTTRLLLLLEYIMKHLYDAPPCLLQQIEWNLVISPGLSQSESSQSSGGGGATGQSRNYCSVPHVEQAYRRRISQDTDLSMRPKFYALTNTELNNQETPKLDGLACNFVLGTPDKLKYPQLLSALLSLLNCAGVCDRWPAPPLSALCAAHYCFQTAWRLLITMPPSTPHIEEISGGTAVPLHALIWAPRAAHHKTFSPWLKDALVKQGLYTQYAENLLSRVSTACDNVSHTIWLATKTFKQLKDNISDETGLPSLVDVMTVNCILLRLRVLLTNGAGAEAPTQASPPPPPVPPSVTPPTAVVPADPAPPAANAESQQFITDLLDLIEIVFQCCRVCVSRDSAGGAAAANAGEDSNSAVVGVEGGSSGGMAALEGVMRCCGSRAAPWLRVHLPTATRSALERAGAAPQLSKPISSFAKDAIPSESGILHVLSMHGQLMSAGVAAAPLLLLAAEAVATLGANSTAVNQCQPAQRDRAVALLLPAVVDGRLEYLQEGASGILSQLLPSAQHVEQAIHQEVLRNMYPVMVGDLQPSNEKILRGMVKYWEKVLERPAGRLALEELFGEGKRCLGEVLIAAPSARQPYSSRVVRLFNKLFAWCESSSPPVAVCVSVMSRMGSACRASSPNTPQLTPLTSALPAITDATEQAPATSPGAAVGGWLAGACLAGAPTTQVTVRPGPAQMDVDALPTTRNGQNDPAQQSESCSWSGGGSDSKESVAIALLSETTNNNDNATLLSNLTKHMILHCDEVASMSLLSALISLAPEALRADHAGLPLPRLLREAARLADAHSGSGHRELLPAALRWLNTCVESLSEQSILEALEQGSGEQQQKAHLEAACHLLAYIADALHATCGGSGAAAAGGVGAASAEGVSGQLPAWDAPIDITPDTDWADDPQDEDDTSADDSDEDSMLHLKLCTFTTTAREFMNQHWYHCHTCKMVDSMGVCTVCALVCHRQHDVTYAKYGNFFCDCGAKEDSSCQALVKRSSFHSLSLSRRAGEPAEQQPPPSLLRRRPSSPLRDSSPPHQRRPAYASNLHGVDPWVWESPEWSECLSGLQRLLNALAAPVAASCERHSAVGRHARARQGLAQLHAGNVKFSVTDQLMVPTLGSQEGAFENVRMSYTGEQGQAIRQLISAHMVRRVAMCCMALPHGRRQHLAVSHEKGKITILQLSQLLKQADSSKRKLTLTRLTSAPVPFTVLSLSASPWNEDVLAVCGLRECHVITFTGGGSVYERLVMQPALDPGNFIIRSIWLPGNQTQLALITADFVKIYDLSQDASLPEYYFLVPSGKVRDVTFVSQESGTYMLCMGSAGHIYWQAMNEVSHAVNGPFYITNTVEVIHNDIKDVTGQVGGGGVSIYYSHTLKMLFFSYAQGKSFMAPLTSVEETLKGVTLIQLNHGGNNSSGSGGGGGGGQKEGRNKGAQALCQWQEVPGHPGLVTAVLQASNNPVVMMLTPTSILLQEIKVIPAKAKITDMVAVRHSAAGDSKTTLILLCEDGSLRIYAAAPDLTGYWLSSSVAPPPSAAGHSALVPRGRRLRLSTNNRNKVSQASGKPGNGPMFPIDFFEHCIAMGDVEFGGNDLLQVYNTAQIKHRLNTNGLYVVSTKLSGFTLEITNSDSGTVITGIRVLLGNQDVIRTPSYIEVCGRTIPTVVVRNRWYDIPLTREESLQADKKLSVTFGPSQDPEGVIMVDSVKVYGRNKEAFGWPEENEDGGVCSTSAKVPQENEGHLLSWTPPGVERLGCALLEVLELSLGEGQTRGASWGEAGPRDTATSLLCAPCPPPLQTRCKALLHALMGQQYHQHKDQAILSHVMEQLYEMYSMEDPRNADPENYFRLVLLARAIAAARPQNLLKYSGVLPSPPTTPSEWSNIWSGFIGPDATPPTHLAPLLVGVLVHLGSVPEPPVPPSLAPVDRSGLRHAEHALHALADVTHALMLHGDQTMIDMGNRIYLSLLLSEDQIISFGAKSAIVRVLRPRVKRRRVYIPSPPATPGASSTSIGTVARPDSPIGAASGGGAVLSGVSSDQNQNQARHQFMDVDQVVDMSRLLGADPEGLELLDIPPDADDETMVELAIVLSLQQERGGSAAASGGAPTPPAAHAGIPRRGPGSGAPSDATASMTGSDDDDGEAEGEVEGEVEAEAGSVAGGSAGMPEASPVGRSSESGSGTSGRSSAYGETGARLTSCDGVEACGGESQWGMDAAGGGGAETAAKVRALRLALLDLMVGELPSLRDLPGIRTIPFMQVLLMLGSAMDCAVSGEQAALERLLSRLVAELALDPEGDPTQDQPPVHCRTPRREMQLLIMRLLSVLMARWKPVAGTPAPSAPGRPPSEWHAARATAAALRDAGAAAHCGTLLRALLPHWREQGARGAVSGSSGEGAAALATGADATAAVPSTPGQAQLLKPQPPHPLPDMQPFFLRQYVKSHAWDVLENYPNLLTEMALRLPYQVQKHCDPPAPPLNPSWHPLLCEYMMNQQTPFLRKQVRKLLLMMCGTKEKYRQLRDVHALSVHLEGVHRVVEGMHFSYDNLVQLMDHLKACVEIVVSRTGNWQHMCTVQSPTTLAYLMSAACMLDEGVAPTVLQLLQGALCPKPPQAQDNNERNERGRSAESDASVTVSSKFQELMVPQLVQQIQQQVSMEQFRHFIRVFLLETNSTAVRWQAHALLLAIYENSSTSEQGRLVKLMWELWPALPQFGRKTAQFVDLLGYFSLKTPDVPMEDCLKSAVNLLKAQNSVLTLHGNAPIYSALSNYVELEGYYLESEPCLVCNNPEVPMATIKLSTIKIDSKFTTTTQIVKLVGSHTISRIGLRIGDLKRSKMVRTINVFYNNRTVQAVQELRNKPGMWHKAKHVVLLSGQTEVRIDFPLPIVACNLMMEYADFYENTQASGESLQCPRCSAAVPANPGVCANCGENVFQCHKCRAINYDEKDPFLCHACGFCKYAKFDYTLTARSCCAVDRIENDEDRKKMVAAIGLLLDKADRVYRQLVANKPLIENLLHKISEHRVDVGRGPGEEGSGGGGGGGGGSTSSGAQVNRVIQYVAHKYCVDSKNHFDDLSKIIQRVLACRRELVAYDRLQSEQLKADAQPAYTALLQQESNKTIESEAGHCYGCALSAASHCLTLLRALASSPEHRQRLCQLGLVQELVQHNLRRGTPQSQEEVRQLICVVTRDNLPATKELCRLLSQRITLGLLGHAAAQDHTNAVRPLVLLLGGLVKIQDCSDCWEVRLRCIIRLWVWCCPYLSNHLGPLTVMEGEEVAPPPLQPSGAAQDAHALQQVALPCLQYLHHLMQPPPPPKDGSTQPDQQQQPLAFEAPPLDLGAWLAGKVSYADWRRQRSVPRPLTPQEQESNPEPLSVRDEKLALKYTAKWKNKAFRNGGSVALSLGDGGWLQPVMFNPSSKMARDTACQMVKSLCTSYERTKAVLVLLTNFLPEIGSAGEASEQFLQLYQSLASEAPWKQFLALRGVLSLLADLLTKEIDHLHKLEETTLTSDLAQGYALKRLTELLAMFLEEGGVRRAYKGRLMGAVLGGYLSLRRLVVQRTRLIDDTQEKLLELLEEMTTGTEAETAEFMAVCVETVKKYPLHDFRTPVFIFERLCSIIYPEENDIGEFFLTLEKDPQQEDFLQGRMLGNPYSSVEAGLGPLMRDVKNKICADCELVALLEDDNGMELLVNNKIMSLDLPVKDVYKKVWTASGEGENAMRVVYRMRGLLGDATEEFVETLSASSTEAVDDEQLYRMANVLADCGGLEVMLERLAVAGGAGGAARPLACTLLRLLSLCVRARRCVALLTRDSTGALPALLRALQLAAQDEAAMPRPDLTCQLLEIMDRILSVAAGESLESFLQFSLTFGGPEYVQTLLNCTQCPGIRNNQEALSHLTRVLAALVYGNELKMAHLCQHFTHDFNKFDADHSAEDEFRLELFCVLCSGIERNAIGGTLKDYLISLGVVRKALDYIIMHAPCVKPTLLRTDSDELKEFISKPALKYILRFLTGLATDHEPTQMAVCEKVIPIVHRLEQVSSDEHVGSLAENLLEALMSEPRAASKVQEARDYTRQEKKRLAMAMREKQLGALGMKTNDKGQVTAQCSLTHQVQELGEETGAICCICREGYKYQPTKVLGIYTFTKRCGVEEFEVKARKTLGYATVTHFNVVHVECHMAAVRLARSRDEWESAALQNASTKCNGLLPLWGPHVPESAFASCLARHNTYLQECTGHHDIGYQCTVHDLKLLLLRFARERPFHEDTGGGGPLSNMQLVPCLAHMALYVINTTRIAQRALSSLQSYLDWGLERQLESSHEAEGPLYYMVMSLLLHPPHKWRENRLEHLRRVLVLSHARSVSPSASINSLQPEQREMRPYEDYKPYLMFFSLIQLIYDEMFKHVTEKPSEQWPVKLAEAIRHGDEAVHRASERILSTLGEQLLPCQSLEEWCDAAGLLPDLRPPTPDRFLHHTLRR